MDRQSSLSDRLRTHITRARLFPRPGTAIVAVSGGADSVALLALLHGVASVFGLELVVAHIDHGIQPGSGDVGKGARRLAEQYGLPFELGELHLGPDATETGARRARYAWLREVKRRRRARYLVTAHHRDDQIETILLRVLRGSGTARLAGIAARERLRRYDATVAVALLRAAARRVGLVLGPKRARTLLALAAGSSGRRAPLGSGWVAEAAFDRLRISHGVKASPDQVVASAEQGGARFGGYQVEWRPEPAPAKVERSGWTTWLPATGWELRPPKAGDRLIPLGGVGRRPLRRLLMEARVPRGERAAYPAAR